MSLCTTDNDKVDEEGPSKPDDEDEDEEDVDFNPFQKETLSPEPASSSISSDIEGQDGDFPKPLRKDPCVGDSNEGEEEVVMQAERQEREVKKPPVSKKSKKRKSEGDDDDDDDAICKRTRAKYSLASFTLDELETFLQETDDEDDFHNVDDEEEYRKFLTAVLHGGDGDGGQLGEEDADGNAADEDDEDNDADFEIELEELLESDVDDDNCNSKERKRPETRQNRRQKGLKKKGSEQVHRPLRPILPIFPNGVVACFANVEGRHLRESESGGDKDCLINGVFNSQQIGQLHCLIHEHVQLLIQVFSLCVLDPNRQDVASQLHGLIFEILHKRNEVVACRSVPYPGSCFRPPYMCPSVQDEVPNSHPADTGSLWAPFITGPIFSILDVAPFNLVGKYMEDVHNASEEYRRRALNFECDSRFEREPLFHMPCSSFLVDSNGEVPGGCVPPVASISPSTPGQKAPKKTLAATIVESAKKDSVALVPKDISKLAQRFFPLFNPALFPHKPPSLAVANRILFTEAEDELLALGMMEYNTDWKAIQQRFLPCKSKHQIFVRQKNRCSSKASENPIKAVRRMKTSPLNAEEIERIKEGMRVFKSDWMSIWKFMVPHRDPSLLPRQFRIALGTQRSYKQDDAKKEKRRILESIRRKNKSAELANCQMASDKEENPADVTCQEKNGDDHVDNAHETYVHQAFLSDWRPGSSSVIPSVQPCSNFRQKELPNSTLLGEAVQFRQQPNNVSRYPLYSHSTSFITHLPSSNTMQPNYQSSGPASNNSKAQIQYLPYRARRNNGPRMVKLAPELPPVNLPSSARIISQSAFKSSQSGVSMKVYARVGGANDAGKQNVVPQISHATNSGTTNSVKVQIDKSSQVTDDVTQSHPEEPAAVPNISLEERSTDADLQMHPLLFQSPGDGHLPYFPLGCITGTSTSFTFFSGNQPQLNLSLFHNPLQAKSGVDSFNKSSKSKESNSGTCNIDFHPLLQRTDEENSELVGACSSRQQFGKLGQFQNHFDSVQVKSLVNSSSFAATPKSSSTKDKANELDLEIHLSSTSMTEATKGTSAVGLNSQLVSKISECHMGNGTEAHKTNSSCDQSSENCPTGHETLLSDADISGVPSSNVSRCDMDEVGDLSQPGIVMEQEELSDSEDEIEEHVEFECEEMADSDGKEHSDSEPVTEEIHNPVTEGVSNNADSGDQHCELSSTVLPQCNASILTKTSHPSVKLSLTSIGTTRSWLSLDSGAPVDHSSTKHKHEDGAVGVCPSVKRLTQSRPNRSSKKGSLSTKRPAMEKDITGMAQQLSLGPLAVSTLRRPRKQASRMNTSLTMGMTAENARHSQDEVD